MASSESEMMSDLAAADAAGDTELAQHIAGKIKAARTPAEQPGLLRRALTWATTPSKAMEPILAQQKVSNPGGIVGKDSPDWLAGAASAVSGAPGFNQYDTSPAYDERMARFGSEHPIASRALPLAGAMSQPGMLPAQGGQRAVLDSVANRLAARTLKGTAGEYKALGEGGVQDLGNYLLENKSVRFGSSPQAVAERVSALPQATGQRLSGAIEALDQTGAQVSKKSLADGFLKLAEEAKAGGPGSLPLVAKYEKAAGDVLRDIETTGRPTMSFKQAEEWKRAYQAPINYSKMTNTPLEMGSKEVASAARQAVEDAAGVAGEGTQLGADFLNAKQESGLAQQAAKMATGAEGRRTARNMLSPSGTAASLAAVTGAIMTGHPMAGIPAVLAGPALQLAKTRLPATMAVLAKGTQVGRITQPLQVLKALQRLRDEQAAQQQQMQVAQQ